eukprot:m51a1_g12572 hypothetical protein (86) ;mRNA; r:4490-4747
MGARAVASGEDSADSRGVRSCSVSPAACDGVSCAPTAPSGPSDSSSPASAPVRPPAALPGVACGSSCAVSGAVWGGGTSSSYEPA